jgi:hypothetical protein
MYKRIIATCQALLESAPHQKASQKACLKQVCVKTTRFSDLGSLQLDP